MKTLHPKVQGGILAIRDEKEHMRQLDELDINTIDMVVINLYPFKETIRKPNVELEDAIENIDIGGPAMLRSAAKNHKDVIVICDPEDYIAVLSEIKESGSLSYKTKYRLALKTFEHTSSYDAMISDYLKNEGNKIFDEWTNQLPENLTMTFERLQSLRYGENPHQKAYYYKEIMPREGALTEAKQLHGKELSFNNINDTNGAVETLREYEKPTIVAVKHANPCGIGSGDNIYEAYLNAYSSDPISIFGGIIAANRVIDEKTAEEINKIFIEIVIAPGFTDEALEVLKSKQNIRVLQLKGIEDKANGMELDIKRVSGGILVQEVDSELYKTNELRVVTKKKPTEEEMEQLEFAMKAVKHVKSNGIVIAKDNKTIGIGPGQVNRIWAVKNAIKQANFDTKGAVLASDAFFPFDDCVTEAAMAGITAIIQPGGSMKDEDSIKKADELGIAMVFTGMRHFKH